MNCIGTYDGTIFYNPANKFCIISVKTADQSVPAEARSNRRYKDHLIRFTAVGYEIPRTDAVELELDGEWAKGKYGVQLQVEQWREIVPRTKNGVEGYLASGLIKGIGPKTAADIVERFGVDTLDILEHQPERLLEIRGITENKLEDIKASYAENRMLQGIMTLLAPFKITPKTALKIYQYFGPTSVEILEKSPFELCQISGFGFRRVDAIVQKSGGDLHDPMRIKGAVFCALDEGKSKRGHLYISSEELEKSALKLLNEKIPVPELRLHQQEVRDMMQEMILNGAIVSVKDNIYLPRVFAQEDETARRIAQRLVTQMPVEHIAPVLEQVKVEMGLRLSAQQEAAVYAAFRHGLSVITGSPGTGKTTVLRTILEVYRRLHPDGKIALMAPTGRASRRMSESTGFEDARTLHSGLGLTSEEDEGMLALYARLNNTTTSDAYWEIGEALCNDFHRERPNSGYEMAGNQQAGTGSPVSGTQTDLAGYERRGELKTVQQAERASGQEIHQTLSLLLAMLPLQPAHRNHLHSPKRGLSDEQIDRIGFKSTPPPFLCRSITERLMKQGCKVEGVPGFYLDDSGRWTMNFYRKNAGILIPAVGYDGMIHGLQILLDSPLKQKDDPPDKSGAKYIWFSSSSKNMGVTSGSPVHFIGNPSARVVYVIEGLLKADISHCLTNRTFAAIAGANNTSQLDTLFALLAQNGTEEIIEAHDMDKYSNQMTSNGASKIYLMARKNGMACRQLTWNPNYKGFDDWQLALREKEQKEKEVQRMNFKQQYLCGKCDFTYIDGCVELWHTRAEKDLDLTEYLGLTKEEYQIFLAQGNRALKDILDSQRVFRRFCIYQLCLSETQTVPFAFKRLDALHKAGYEQPPAAAYQTVWSAEVCCPKGQNDMEVLGRLFLDFNEHLPEDYRGRPLAPSDVVELDCQGKRTYFYVNDCRDFAPVRFSPFLCKRLPEPAQKQE